jgi:nicotinate dehydrogenase subunit A
MSETIHLVVNGSVRETSADATTPLLAVLRNDFGLRAAKYGCGLEQCGACTVIVGGEATHACSLAIGRIGKREVWTLEGLAEGDVLHPLQEAFLEQQAGQCAYCVPGVIMAAAALLAWNDTPNRQDVERALARNLCRCGSQQRMIRAIAAAAERMRERGP